MTRDCPTYWRFLLPLLLIAAAIAALAFDVPVGMGAKRLNNPTVARSTPSPGNFTTIWAGSKRSNRLAMVEASC